ncbi:hypothetical protein BHE74_00044002, partial [Ensete ventricosum]
MEIITMFIWLQEVDIWSYGCLLLELLTLQVPYQGRSESELYDLLQVNAKILKLLVDLFYQCTRGNPADRPSAKHIYDSLSVVSPR